MSFKLPIYMPSWLMLQRWSDRERLGFRAARRAGREAAPHGDAEIAAVSAVRPRFPASREERQALLAAAAACFCLLGGYYVLRPIREALALEVGVQQQLLLFTDGAGGLQRAVAVYWWLVRRTPRTRLLWLVNIAVRRGCSSRWHSGCDALPRDRVLAVGVFRGADHLQPAADRGVLERDVRRVASGTRQALLRLCRGRRQRRRHCSGNLVVRGLVVESGLPPLIIGACVSIVLSAALVTLARADAARARRWRGVPDGAMPVGGRALDDLKRLATTPYLLGIAGVIIIGQTIGAFMYNEQGKYIAALYPSDVERAAMFANLEIAVNLLSLFFQAVVVTWLTRRGSVALSLSAMPALVGASFVVLALIPTGAVLLVTQVIRRAADYGLGKPPREMLFTVLNPESKFKSKSLIDTVLQRGADTGGQWLYKLVEGAGVVGMSWMCVGLCAALLAATRTLGRAFEARREQAPRARAGRRETRRLRLRGLPAQRLDAAGKPHVDLRAIVRLAAPLMATNAVQALLNLTDLWFIGRLSTDAVAAMGSIYWILTCAVLLFGGVGLAVQTFVAQAFGSRRKAHAARALWNALWATLAMVPLFLGAGVRRPAGCCIPSGSSRMSRRWRSSTGRRAWAAPSSARWPGRPWASSTASPRCASPC